MAAAIYGAFNCGTLVLFAGGRARGRVAGTGCRWVAASKLADGGLPRCLLHSYANPLAGKPKTISIPSESKC